MTTGAPTSPHSARPPRRSRPSRYLPLGVAVWLVLEIWLLTLVADRAGGLTVLLLLLAGAVLGAGVVKRAGRRAFRRLSEAVQRGGTPAEGGGSGLTMLAGLLLILPGLLSDLAGLLLLIPPVRGAVGRLTERTVESRLRAAAPGSFGDVFQQARMHRPDGKVVQGEVVRDAPADPPREQYPPLNR
ncbi:FxsA family membrane protein [Streptomyces tropicalis]|uniref:FxsA family protein n=1 Tax=Streptomyces tropicalis TaxID=3034234 RepID=A0ABT6ACJ0_9ACTN|nr:FxsA family membrane protein [Streptomyces tropicalis]MDF3302359.1 FxsA family protein [Streptomyces tropicalis]